MILKTFDGKEMFITPEQADNVAKAISAGTKMIQIGSAYIAAGAVATIMPGGEPPFDRSNLIAAHHELDTEEKAARVAHNKEMFAKMKQDLIDKGIKGFHD